MFRLTRRFSVLSAITLAAITLALVAGFQWSPTRNLERQTAAYNASLAHLIAAIAWSDHVGARAGVENATREHLAQRPETNRLGLHLHRLTDRLGIVTVNLYTPSGRTLYSTELHSTELRQIGGSKASDPQFIAAISTREPVTRTLHHATFASMHGTITDRWIAETYTPIVAADGTIVGVVEVHGDITDYVAQIRRSSWSVAAFGVLVLGLLYVVLLLIVRRADAILHDLYQRLARFNVDLERGVADRTRTLVAQQDVLSWITKSDDFRQGSSGRAMRSMVRAAAGVLGADRASVWLLDETRTALVRRETYDSGNGPTAGVTQLDAEAHRPFIQALERSECVATADAVTDPGTACLADSYLRPLGTSGVLATAVSHKGRFEGLVLIERMDRAKPWAPEQQLFAAVLSNLVEVVIERTEREATETSLKAADEPATPGVSPPAQANCASDAPRAATLDEQQITRMRKTHAKLLARLTSIYLAYAPGAVSKLASSLALDDPTELSTGAHSLKSSSGNVGASLLAALCRDLEQHAKPLANVDDRCRHLVADIAAEFALVETALQGLAQETAATAGSAAPSAPRI